jgi:hypothetical protein
MGESGLKKIFPTLICSAPGGQRLNSEEPPMPGTRESLRLHLKPGMLVTHRIHGVGRVLGEWGPVVVFIASAAAPLARVPGSTAYGSARTGTNSALLPERLPAEGAATPRVGQTASKHRV